MSKKQEQSITILRIEPGQAPVIKEIPNTPEAMQTEVGGYFECIFYPTGCAAVVNEEGKINGMEPNRRIGATIVCGPFFLCCVNHKGEFSSLTKTDIHNFSHLFAEIPTFTGDETELTPGITLIGFQE